MERLGLRFDRVIIGEGLIEGQEGVHPDALFALYRLPGEDRRFHGAQRPGDPGWT